MPFVVIFRSFRTAKIAPSRGAGQASFDATFEMDSDDEFSVVYAKKRRVSGNSLPRNVYPGMFTKTWTLPAPTTRRL